MKRIDRFHEGLLEIHTHLSAKCTYNCNCVHCRKNRRLAKLCYEIDDYLKEKTSHGEKR